MCCVVEIVGDITSVGKRKFDMTIKADGQKWSSKASQEVRNEAYARKAKENAPVAFSGQTNLHLKDFSLKYYQDQLREF